VFYANMVVAITFATLMSHVAAATEPFSIDRTGAAAVLVIPNLQQPLSRERYVEAGLYSSSSSSSRSSSVRKETHAGTWSDCLMMYCFVAAGELSRIEVLPI